MTRSQLFNRKVSKGGEEVVVSQVMADGAEFHPGDMSPSDAYRGLVSMSSSRFRADVEFHEEPRQVTFAFILITLVSGISVCNIGNSHNASEAFRLAAIGGFVGLVIYVMLQSKDGLMIRPHPMVWRSIHGMTLCYYCVIILLVVLPPNLGIPLFHNFFRNSESDVTSSIAGPVIPMDCSITIETVGRQLSSVWFAAHTLGFWAKMCLYRDWTICWTYSISFEIAELLLGWVIPEFRECWWDSVFMDMLGANLIGMYMGHLTLKWLSCRNYTWECKEPKGSVFSSAGQLLKRFIPFTWSAYVWPKDFSEHSWLASIGWISALCIELNSFALIHALQIKSSHWSNGARQFLLAAQGAQAVPEWYEYIKGNTPRIGHNCWLLYMVAAFEIILAIRYGRGGQSYGPLSVPTDISIIIGMFMVLWCTSLAINSYRNRSGRPVSTKWSICLRFMPYVPLIFLARRWAY